MRLRKLVAGTLAVTMVVGSGFTALAADQQTGTATGTGDSVGHVDKEVLTVTLPTATDNVFDYHVDPERVIDLAGSLKDGTTVTKNAEGVYFKQKDGTYASSSEAIEFEGKNSIDVDVSVAAEVIASAEGKDIGLVSDDTALTAATTPALLMTLKVGDATQAITSTGATAKATLAGKQDNFVVKSESGEFKYVAKDDAAGWEKTSVQLSGKTNEVDVPSDMTAPTIQLTWTIEKHMAYTDETGYGNWSGDLWLGKDSSTGFDSSSLTVEVSDGGTTYIPVASDKYTMDSNNWVSISWANITEALGGEPSGTVYVRVTDGTTRYIFENN